MKIVGFSGGRRISDLGTVDDVALFFACVKQFVEGKYPDQDWHLLTDRLYKRYLRSEELHPAREKMVQVKQVFTELPSSLIDWNNISDESRLNPELPILSDVFDDYFSTFLTCAASAEFMHENVQPYPSGYLKVMITEIPYYAGEQKRPLEQYDALGADDLPFWIQQTGEFFI
ncbi:hypothetical protein KKJ25_21600 [Xenorhabdus bovienii]|uniref:hypothetical protein n=1 Tax=Xenorhabdus bovienii TaxID=40576 RepID=UPI00237D0893|nr:hypothetical protein [Xenorhabdus bovienii]MDE1497413.1 hypothetical protein [Xenorhabdus bovienii]